MRLVKLIIYFCMLILLLEFVISECGDGTCDSDESTFNCESDCPSGGKDFYCDERKDNKCDPDCDYGDPDCERYLKPEPVIIEKQGLSLFQILLFSFSIIPVIIIAVYVYRKTKKEAWEKNVKNQDDKKQQEQYLKMQNQEPTAQQQAAQYIQQYNQRQANNQQQYQQQYGQQQYNQQGYPQQPYNQQYYPPQQPQQQPPNNQQNNQYTNQQNYQQNYLSQQDYKQNKPYYPR